MGLMLGVLYSLHLLVKDYQALTGPKLLRLLFKRDANATNPMVRTKVKTVTQMWFTYLSKPRSTIDTMRLLLNKRLHDHVKMAKS